MTRTLIIILASLILVGCVSAERKAAIEQCKIETGISSPLERLSNHDTWFACLVRNGWNREEIAREAANQQKQKQSEENQKRAYIDSLRNNCRGFGFKEGTTEFSNCLMTQHQNNITNAQMQGVIDSQNAQQQRQAWKDFSDFNARRDPNYSGNRRNCISQRNYAGQIETVCQ